MLDVMLDATRDEGERLAVAGIGERKAACRGRSSRPSRSAPWHGAPPCALHILRSAVSPLIGWTLHDRPSP